MNDPYEVQCGAMGSNKVSKERYIQETKVCMEDMPPFISSIPLPLTIAGCEYYIRAYISNPTSSLAGSEKLNESLHLTSQMLNRNISPRSSVLLQKQQSKRIT